MIKISDELKIQIPVEADSSGAAQAKFQASINNMVSKMNSSNIPKIQITVSKINGAQAIADFKKEIQNAISGVVAGNTTRTSNNNGNSRSVWNGIFRESVSGLTARNTGLDPLNQQLRQAEKAAEKTRAQLETVFKVFGSGNTTGQFLEQLNQKILSLGSSAQTVAPKFNELNKLYNQIQTKLAGKSIADLNNNDISEVQKLVQEYNKLFKEVTSVYGVTKQKNNQEFVSANNINKLNDFINTLERFGSANNKLFNNRGLSEQYNSLMSQAGRFKATGNFSETDIKRLRSQLGNLKQDLREAGMEGQKFGTKLYDQLSKLGIYFSANTVIMGTIRQIKKMISTVIELDSAVTDLQIATGYTRNATKELVSTYAEMAKELGATTLNVAQASDAWLRQGYSIKETNTLIKNSMMLSKLGQIDSAQATKALTSAMKGYKVSVEDSIGIVDKFTNLDMSAAVSAGYIATAMAETATGARLAGVQMDTLAGYIANVGEVTQDGAESVGIFFKTLFARMGNIKEGKLVDPETQENISSVEVTLKNLDIKLRESGGEFRNFEEVLNEVAEKWSSLGSVSQRAIAVAFSGTRNQEKFLTLMDNYGKSMEYAEIAANSAGTSLHKYETSYLQSVEAAQMRFTTQFGALSQAILSSEFVKGTINTGTGILGFLTSATTLLDAMPTLATVAAGAIAMFSNKGWLKNLSDIRTYALLQSGGNTERVDIFSKRLYGNTSKWLIAKAVSSVDNNTDGKVLLIA